jgi:hypothetical protein
MIARHLNDRYAPKRRGERVGMARRLVFWLGLAFLFAATSFAINWVLAIGPAPVQGFSIDDVERLHGITILLNWLWLANAIAASFFIRWRALWLLLSLPLLLFWPFIDYQFMAACAQNRANCV